jgi:hypothetical protein
MRLKPTHIYLIVFAILVSANYSFSQESASPVLEGMEAEKPNNGGMDYNLTDGEGSIQRIQPLQTVTPSSQRDSTRTRNIQAKPKASQQKPSGEAQPKPEESVLGFNFLYYIFQKYKMSDIID